MSEDGKRICMVLIRCAKMLITLLEALLEEKNKVSST